MRKRIGIWILLVCVLLAFPAFLLFRQRDGGEELSPLTCTFLKVGKADAMVLETEGLTMVIDTGEEEDGQELADFLKARKASRIDILIITHFDKDHVGGADTLISRIPADRVLLPDYPGSGAEYEEFIAALERASIEPERVREPLSFPFGSASVTVIPPESDEIPEGAGEYDNELSLVTTVVHGSVRLLFAGDIEKARIRELNGSGQLEECDLLKLPHHGVWDAALEDLMKAVRPRYAVICSSDKNPAEEKTLELLRRYGVKTMETRNGDVALTSDGKRLALRQKTKGS